MKTISLCFIAFFCIFSFAQNDLVFPWVTNNSGFQATVSINNFGSQTSQLQLVANRAENSTDTPTETINLTLAPLEQVVMTASELFTTMGQGSGYSIRISGDTQNISGALVVNSTGTASGASPSQADIVSLSNAGNFAAFNYLPLDTGFSAPVVYNAGTESANVTYHAYQNGKKEATATQTIPAGKPFATTTQTLFPDLMGNIYVVAEANQPLIGLAFLFNDVLEPSMSTAKKLDFLPKGPDAQLTVFFEQQIQPIFNQTCGNCHIGSSVGGLNLDPGSAHGNIVGVRSLQNPNMSLITPGNPDQSYLYQKLLENGNFFNERMPRNRAPLSTGQIELVKTWILEGAQNN